MRQTAACSGLWKLYTVAAALLLCILCTPVSAQNSAFQDLAADHWAFNDVNFLVRQGYMEGYPDGTFKGRKVTTRYDVALILARILRRLEEKKDGVESATEMERAALGRLTKEFRDELGLLGVRVDSLERRMVTAETAITDFERRLPKVGISGFYEGRGQYIMDPTTVSRNERGRSATFTRSGLVTFYQRMYLRFTGRPAGDRIQTFLELQGFMQGRTWNHLIYDDLGRAYGPNPFDKIDDYVTRVQNDRYVIAEKIHFKSKAKSMEVRVFSGEGVRGINNPTNILTEDTGVVRPFQGIEFVGSDKGLSYQGGLYKTDRKLGDRDEHDMVGGRLLWKLPARFSQDALTLGTSYAEKIADYKTRGNTNAVKALDINYTTDRIGRLQATAEFLASTNYHEDTADNQKRSMKGLGRKYDLSLSNGGFTGTVKHYDFNKDFRALMAPIWAYDIGDVERYGWPNYQGYPYNHNVPDNYGRVGYHGEKLTRFSAGYDFGNTLLAIANNLSMEGTYLSKTWDIDPFRPMPSDGHSGKKYTFHLLSDFSDSTTLKYDFEQKMRALKGSRGIIRNVLELNLRLNDSVSTVGKIDVLADRDEIDSVGGVDHEFNQRIGYFEINSNINPRVYAKGSVEHQVRWANAPRENMRVDYIGEATYNLTPTTTLIGGIQHVDYEDKFDGKNSSLANAIIAELKKNFTSKFRGRAFYTRGVIDYKDRRTDTIDRENIYGELIYDATSDASIRLKFGYDYPDNWRWAISSVGNGRGFENIMTQKMLIFEARTNF